MHYLIIRPGAIGDNLLAFPIIQILRAPCNNPHITFVGNAAVLPLALDAGIVEEVSDYNSRQWSELFSTNGICSPTLQALLQRMDIVICWLRDPEHIVEHNLRALGIQHIIIAPGRPSDDEQISIVDYLARTLDLQPPVPFVPLLIPGNGTDLSIAPADALLPIAIHPGSGGAHKCWPIKHFALLIEALWQRSIPVLLISGPADTERLAELNSLLPPVPSPLLLTPLINVPLRSIAQQLQHCRGYIGNDSGITHLAALLAIPTIVLFGPSNPIIWRPHGNTTRVLYDPLLKNLQVDSVLYTVKDFFDIHQN